MTLILYFVKDYLFLGFLQILMTTGIGIVIYFFCTALV